MYHFEYVPKSQTVPIKKELISIIHAVQDILRNEFTFRYDFVGSAKRNMITQDVKSNIGFDFDVNIEINDDDEEFTPQEIKHKIKNALDQVAPRYGYSFAEDSTRVLTIKQKNIFLSKINHSCDFAIVYNYVDKNGKPRQQYILYNKKVNRYTWEEQKQGYYLLPEKAEWIKDNGYQQDLRAWYLSKKNTNTDPNKRSRNLYADAVHEICQKYGYYNRD